MDGGMEHTFEPPSEETIVLVRKPEGDTNALTLCEVEVFDAEGRNVALNQATEQSSTAHSGEAANAVDGDTNNGVYVSSAAGTCTHTNPESDNNQEWRVIIKTATPIQISRVVLHNRARFGARLIGAEVQVDGVKWGTVLAGGMEHTFEAPSCCAKSTGNLRAPATPPVNPVPPVLPPPLWGGSPVWGGF